jgi:hypothetical protein
VGCKALDHVGAGQADIEQRALVDAQKRLDRRSHQQRSDNLGDVVGCPGSPFLDHDGLHRQGVMRRTEACAVGPMDMAEGPFSQ